MSVPRPKMNAQLRPFIEAFDLAIGRSEQKSGLAEDPSRSTNSTIWRSACAAWSSSPLNDSGSTVVPHERCNTVALIRSPLMVVAYKQFAETPPYVVGAFVADDAVNLVLRKSEPPAHDRWDEDSGNLRDEDGAGKATVRAVLASDKERPQTLPGGGCAAAAPEAAAHVDSRARARIILPTAEGRPARSSAPGQLARAFGVHQTALRRSDRRWNASIASCFHCRAGCESGR